MKLLIPAREAKLPEPEFFYVITSEATKQPHICHSDEGRIYII